MCIEHSIIIITIKHLQQNWISAVNNPYGVDMQLKKHTKLNWISSICMKTDFLTSYPANKSYFKLSRQNKKQTRLKNICIELEYLIPLMYENKWFQTKKE